MVEEVQNLINTGFPSAKAEFDDNPTDRITGTLIWKGFVGYSQIERQKMFRERIRNKLPPELELHVGFIMTLTPSEAEVMSQHA